MTKPCIFPGAYNAYASSSSLQATSKRKYEVEESTDDEVDMRMRIRSPPTKRRSTFPPRDLMTDHSHSASDEDQIYGTTGMDPAGDWPMLQDDLVDGRAVSDGSRFRPGSGELEMIQPVSRRHQARSQYYPTVSVYPSLTSHPHPCHLTKLSSYSSPNMAESSPASPRYASSSSWTVQPYSTSLHAPVPNRGLFQPTHAAAVPSDASATEKARAQHGPHCKSIPKLVMSQYPDPVTGEMSMWTMCGDCGACEIVA
ncbi:MAG: hypothetical protein TREMPRED_003513 [Tremellales sp. Tagirdzhanova-0007]|nr:MAG: hypothetical protein TREMPRED_003513 [Tremellales sp. Tagirdzhanova-0007]